MRINTNLPVPPVGPRPDTAPTGGQPNLPQPPATPPAADNFAGARDAGPFQAGAEVDANISPAGLRTHVQVQIVRHPQGTEGGARVLLQTLGGSENGLAGEVGRLSSSQRGQVAIELLLTRPTSQANALLGRAASLARGTAAVHLGEALGLAFTRLGEKGGKAIDRLRHPNSFETVGRVPPVIGTRIANPLPLAQMLGGNGHVGLRQSALSSLLTSAQHRLDGNSAVPFYAAAALVASADPAQAMLLVRSGNLSSEMLQALDPRTLAGGALGLSGFGALGSDLTPMADLMDALIAFQDNHDGAMAPQDLDALDAAYRNLQAPYGTDPALEQALIRFERKNAGRSKEARNGLADRILRSRLRDGLTLLISLLTSDPPELMPNEAGLLLADIAQGGTRSLVQNAADLLHTLGHLGGKGLERLGLHAGGPLAVGEALGRGWGTGALEPGDLRGLFAARPRRIVDIAGGIDAGTVDPRPIAQLIALSGSTDFRTAAARMLLDAGLIRDGGAVRRGWLPGDLQRAAPAAAFPFAATTAIVGDPRAALDLLRAADAAPDSSLEAFVGAIAPGHLTQRLLPSRVIDHDEGRSTALGDLLRTLAGAGHDADADRTALAALDAFDPDRQHDRDLRGGLDAYLASHGASLAHRLETSAQQDAASGARARRQLEHLRDMRATMLARHEPAAGALRLDTYAPGPPAGAS
ncbi:MAG: hypothetical protein AAF772_03335 [Acidobacteriota bacterium]